MSEFEDLDRQYRHLLMEYVASNQRYEKRRKKADAVLMPKELFELDEVFKRLGKQTDTSRADIGKMIAENQPAFDLMKRTNAALERAIETMKLMTAKLDERIKQARKKKSSGKKKA